MRERRAALAAARAALTEIGSVLWEEPGVELGPLLREIDDMGRLVDAARMVVVDEAMTRGEMRSYVGPHQEGGEPLDAVAAGLVGVGWVRAWSPTMKAGGAVGLVQLTERLRSYESRQLREAVLGGRVGLRNAAVCVREMDRLAPDCARTRCRRSGMPSSSWGPTSDRWRSERSGPRLLAEYGSDGELQHEQDVAARRPGLSQPYDAGDGTFEYRLRLDAEGKTVLEAALGPLAAPRPADGVRDVRGSDRRRADGLIEIVRRAVACPDGVPTGAKAQVFLRIDLDGLVQKTGCALTVGSGDAGAVLPRRRCGRIGLRRRSPPRRHGRTFARPRLGPGGRSLTPAQVKALRLRDAAARSPAAGCPPNGRRPPIRHRADGGPSDLGNATLLCGRRRDHGGRGHRHPLARHLRPPPSRPADRIGGCRSP